MKLPPLDIPRLLHVRTNRRVRRPVATVVLIHGIGNTGDAWNKIIAALPQDMHVVTIDLLGFGDSPKPKVSYNNRIQARSVIATFIRLRLRAPVILVGHSMGALISIEIAKRYPYLIKGLVLCSPPLYKNTAESDKILTPDHFLTSAYESFCKDAGKKPTFYQNVAKVVKAAKLVSPAFDINEATLPAYLAALKASIINQTSFKDIMQLKLPIHIIYGLFDPLVVPANIKKLGRDRTNVTTRHIVAMHEITGTYAAPIIKSIKSIMS